jgi:hypothetical protein
MTEDEIRKIKETGKLPIFKLNKIGASIFIIFILLIDCWALNIVIFNHKGSIGFILLLLVINLIGLGPLIYSLFQDKIIVYPSKLSVIDKEWLIEKVCYETKYNINDLSIQDHYRQIILLQTNTLLYSDIFIVRIFYDSEAFYINATHSFSLYETYYEKTAIDVIAKLKQYEPTIPS